MEESRNKQYTEIDELEQEERKQAVSLADVFFITQRHWPWIIVSVFICMGLATLYILCTHKVYTRSAEILIKEDNNAGSVSDEYSLGGLFQNNTNIKNEMASIQSKDLMDEVVRRLNLDVTYMKEGTFHNTVVYGSELPVQVTVAGFPEDLDYKMTVKVSKSGDVTISNLESDENDYSGKKLKGKLGTPIGSPIGNILVTRTPNYVKGEDVELMVTKSPIESARDAVLKRMNISMSDKDGTVLNLKINDKSMERGDDILRTLIDVYNESWILDKNQIAKSTSSFIDERLAVIEKELGNVDSNISDYKSANLLPDVDAASKLYMDESQKTSAEILALSTQLQMARHIRSYLNSEKSTDQLLPTNGLVDDQTLLSQICDYNRTMLQRNALVDKSSANSPVVKPIDVELASQRKAIAGTVDNMIRDLSTQISGLQGREASTISHLSSNPRQAKYLLSVERQQKVKESLYLYLLEKREENELSQAFTAYNTKIINKPGGSKRPSSPNRKYILAGAFLLGLLIPFGVTYVREMTNTKLRGRKDLDKLVAPFLGEIPAYAVEKGKEKLDPKREIVVQQGKRDIINESFRVLRTNIEFMKSGKTTPGAEVIATTSFNPGSGKTFITVNVARALALKSKRVLVIDGDMRHGSTSVYVGNPSKGLSNVLNGSVEDVNSVIVPIKGSQHMFVLPKGTTPPNPAELLELPRFAEMLDKLRGEYDYIMIDCPPIEVVADTQIINRYVDRTIFIARAGLLERAMIPELDKLYREKKFKNMSVILNGTANGTGMYGNSHGYRYGYGYGYGYGYHYGNDND